MLKILAIPLCMILHPVHVTLTSIDQMDGTDSVRVFFRMYYDDFLRDYHLFDTVPDLNNYMPDKLLPAEMVNNYFNKKVCIYINNKLLNGKLLTMNLADNEISINLICRSVRKPRKITVRNLVSTGLYSDQANMIIIRVKDFEEGIRLTPGHTEETFRVR